MRKILASMLATAMVASMAATMTFAASNPTFTTDTASTGATPGAATKAKEVVLQVSGSNEKYTVPAAVKGSFAASTAAPAANLLNELDGLTFNNVNIDGRVYTVKTAKNAAGDKLVMTLDAPFAADTTITLQLIADSGENLINAASKLGTYTFTAASGGGNETVDDVESTGLRAKNVFLCGPDGNPLPLTETDDGVDKDQNDEDGVQSATTVYFMVDDQYNMRLDDSNFWKMRVNKSSNGKYVKDITDVNKNFSGNLVSVLNGRTVEGTSGRHRFIKVELAEIFTDDEYKIALDVTFTPKSKAVDNANIILPNNNRVTDDVQLKVNDFYFYMKNVVRTADNDWKVGIGGLMLNPLSNDWNEVTYFDEDGDLAFMKFFADSDVSKFYAKLSTKWEHADYASYFNDQDAYIFDFVGSPKISATSRCDLQIYNPFVNADGDETIDPETAVIYQVIDGDLFDVTDNFTYEEGENGEMAFVTRTRFLGTYIICEKAVEEAADAEAPETDLVPEEAPSEVTPDGGANDGGKAPANTGKWA